MLKFTIRDVLWLTFVVAFGVHTWMDRQAGLTRERAYLKRARDEVYFREQAEKRGVIAERRADRFSEAMRQLQVELEFERLASRSVSSVEAASTSR